MLCLWCGRDSEAALSKRMLCLQGDAGHCLHPPAGASCACAQNHPGRAQEEFGNKRVERGLPGQLWLVSGEINKQPPFPVANRVVEWSLHSSSSVGKSERSGLKRWFSKFASLQNWSLSISGDGVGVSLLSCFLQTYTLTMKRSRSPHLYESELSGRHEDGSHCRRQMLYWKWQFCMGSGWVPEVQNALSQPLGLCGHPASPPSVLHLQQQPQLLSKSNCPTSSAGSMPLVCHAFQKVFCLFVS